VKEDEVHARQGNAAKAILDPCPHSWITRGITLVQFDDFAWESLIGAMKALSAVPVIAHVMKGHLNHPQAVPDVLKAVLDEFRGFAQDQSGYIVRR
jgi:hypothetical protein